MFLAASLVLLGWWLAGEAAALDTLLVRSVQARYLERTAPSQVSNLWAKAAIGAKHRNLAPGPVEPAPQRQSKLRPALWWSAGLALAAGGTAWWSGRRADRAYDQYLHSAGFERQREQLRRARHYDRLTGAAFVFMEAGIVLSTYLVFF